jgi:hypothetical protein
MITDAQKEHVERHAYLPEHLPDYVTAISRTEPLLFGNFIAYAQKGLLVFIGYPLEETFDEKRMQKHLEEAIRRLAPERVSVMAPAIPSSLENGDDFHVDRYYRLELSSVSISQKTRNMLNRAGRELSIGKSRRFEEEHEKLVEEFLKNRSVDEATRFIFRGIDRYLSTSETAWIFEARTGRGELVAFDVAEFRPRDYALHMFNFSSGDRYVPGASDLLLSEVVRQAVTNQKKYINLGLGINPGVAFFKEKWGGVAFLPHAGRLYRPIRKGLLEMLLRSL